MNTQIYLAEQRMMLERTRERKTACSLPHLPELPDYRYATTLKFANQPNI